MRNIGEDIWVHEDVMIMAGAPLRLRMTIVRLSDGRLWLHSPTALSPALKQEVEALGPVTFLVGASNGHNKWLLQWQEAFPEAGLYVSGGIPKKLNLGKYHLLDEAFDNIWREDLEREYMPGVSFFNESVFLHKKTRSLIVTDFIQNHSDETPPGLAGVLTKCIFRPLGFKGKCLAPPLKMGFTIKNKVDFAAFVTRVKNWEFERIVVTHGDIIETDAGQVFAGLCERFFK
ncbi:DUF4336 domain-containing protein [Thalassomonas viridans]|uniref:DUF4336 domain-containing protein n=1 Tax=Thalassomonas viridans TaxID=137584 RepID=A0AAE9Z5W7_9GAMM|nr:DUF4336 domain-containing protein [Thalassomonas viridans]WDE07188.1 DUF4336 domain-containing protein [Thalassomonas viridans]